MTAFTTKRWRTSQRNPRVLYVMIGDEPSDDDQMIGAMDSTQLAERVVEDHNRRLPPRKVAR